MEQIFKHTWVRIKNGDKSITVHGGVAVVAAVILVIAITLIG